MPARAPGPLQPDDPHRLGPFAIAGRLGSGGMGVVYLGHHDDGRVAAVKVVHPHLVGDSDFRARFGREITVARRVDAPWCARVLDADALGHRPWLATEYVDGPGLDEQLARSGALPGPGLEELARRLAEALAGLHAAGVVHRDLKPSNVLLAADGPRLIDFGIARSLDATKITHTGHVIGTPAFMAPEQAEGEESGPEADVFSLASVLYYAATGDGPFGTASHPAAMLLRVMQRTPNLGALPQPYRRWLAPCFARAPGDRPTAAELVAAWSPDAAPPTAALDPSERPRPVRAPRLLVVANAALAVLIVVVLAVALPLTPATAAAAATGAALPPDGVLPPITQVAEIPVGVPTGGVAATADGRTMMVAVDGGVRFIDATTRSVSPTIATPDGVSNLSFTPDGARVYLAGRGIWALDVATGAVTGPIGDTGDIASFTVNEDGRTGYATSFSRTDLAVIDLTDGREIGAIPLGTTRGRITRVGDGRVVVTGGFDPENAGRDDQDPIVDIPTGKVIGTLPERAKDIDTADAPGRAFVLQFGGTMQVVGVGSGTPIGPPVIGLPDDTFLRLAVNPGGTAMLGWSSIDGTVLYVADTVGVPRQTIDVGGEINGAVFSPDGRTMYLVIGEGRDTILVYDTSVLVP